MNLVLLDEHEIDARGVARLGDRRARHVRQVIGAEVGTTLRVGVVRGRIGRATVTAVDDERVELEVALDGAAPRRPAIDVILALPRPKALMRALETCASFGVDRIDVVNAWRVDKSYFQSGRVAAQAIQDHLRLGCEQGQTTWVPTCEVHRLLVPYVRDVLVPRLAVAPSTGRLIAHPRAADHIEAHNAPGSRERVVIAVGPERGWIDRELDMFERAGFAAVRLGMPVLRTEAALAALLAQLSLLARLDPQRTEPESSERSSKGAGQ